MHTRSNFVVVFASKSRCINPDATWGTAGDICTSSVTVTVADSDWDEDDWGSGWTERRFDLVKEDGGGDLIKDDFDKYDDHDCDDCGDNTSCNVSIIDFKNFMFPFSFRWRWSL